MQDVTQVSPVEIGGASAPSGQTGAPSLNLEINAPGGTAPATSASDAISKVTQGNTVPLIVILLIAVGVAFYLARKKA